MRPRERTSSCAILLGHEAGLMLRKNENPCHQFDRLGHGGEIAKGRDRLLPLNGVVVGSVPAAGAVRVGAEDVLGEDEPVVPGRFRRLGIVAEDARIRTKHVVGVHGGKVCQMIAPVDAVTCARQPHTAERNLSTVRAI